MIDQGSAIRDHVSSTRRPMAIDISTVANGQARLTPSKVHDYRGQVPAAPSAAIVARPTSWCPKQEAPGRVGRSPLGIPGQKNQQQDPHREKISAVNV